MGRRFGTIILVALSALLLASPVRADVRDTARQQVIFGNDVAQRGLWREAIFRWEKAVEIDPTYAAAYNNLAIGYEHEGELGKADRAYQKAMTLDPKNQQIRQNYEQFKEINERAAENAKP
jgi:Tfp pilus assembly protein PilF